MKMKWKKNLVLFTLFAMNLTYQPAPEVEIEQGILSGKVSTDGKFFEYLGIPYASTNIHTRFQSPQIPPKWEGVLRAVDEHYQCPQPTPFGVMGMEDCLKVNVYVPAEAKKPLAVMVYIHGGAFILGSGGKILVGADFLMKQDIVLVTFNYRLGVLGFLCLGIKKAPGNAGIKDQIAALRWVKKNIAAFGGDPNNVTIFGHSAGATSVSLLLASEGTHGLFNKAIVQSGSSLSNWAINTEPVLVAKLLAKELGYNSDDPMKLYEIFSKISYKDLTAITADKPIGQLLISKLLPLPCVEKDIDGIEQAITDLPYNLLSKKPKNVSVIYGSTDKEGLFFISEETDQSLKSANERYLFSLDLEFKSKNEVEMINKKVKEFYFGNEDISRKTIMNLSDVYGHLYFEMPAIMESESMVNKIAAPIYNYYFTYSGDRNMVKQKSGYSEVTGACHGDDILYLFNAYIWPYKVSKRDQVMIDWMAKMWANFAKYGDPTPDTANNLTVKWKPSNKNQLNFLYIGHELEMRGIPNPLAYKLWKNIYDKYRKMDTGDHYLK